MHENFGKFRVEHAGVVLRTGLLKEDAELWAEGARKRIAAGQPPAGEQKAA